MKAVHVGAGNIGRGIVGLPRHEAGYELVVSDVAEELITSLQGADSYTVRTVGEAPRSTVVDGFRALNSAQDPQALTEEIASAGVVTTAVGAHILRFVAPGIAAGIEARPAGAPRLTVMACENALNATDLLEQEIRSHFQGEDLGGGPDRARAVTGIWPGRDRRGLPRMGGRTWPLRRTRTRHPRDHLGG